MFKAAEDDANKQLPKMNLSLLREGTLSTLLSEILSSFIILERHEYTDAGKLAAKTSLRNAHQCCQHIFLSVPRPETIPRYLLF